MLYMHISRSDLSSAALKPKYLEDKTQNIEIREALNIPKHSKKDSQIQNRGDEPVQYMETTLGVFIHFFKKIRYWKFHKHLNGNSSQITLKTELVIPSGTKIHQQW